MSTIKAGTTTTTAFSVDQDTTGDLNFQAGSVTPLSIKSTGLVSVSNTASFKLPVGTIAQRPASPQNGMMRFNEDLNEVEVYSGGAWQVISSGNLKLKLDFDETTTLDSRISFTRATNGTYFNSSGVLTTAGSGVARFDHRLENGSWVNKGLLIEEQRTNILQRSEELDNSFWLKLQSYVTANQIAAPSGSTTADLVREQATTDFHYFRNDNVSVNMTSTNYTLSMFVKIGPQSGRTRGSIQIQFIGGNFPTVSASFNLTTKTITAGNPTQGAVHVDQSITELDNGWFRVSVTGRTNQNGSHGGNLFFLNDAGASNYAGDITKGMYVWGIQLEAGAFPTSYIATTSASVTRNADVASMTGTNFSSWYNQTEGTVFTQADMLGINAGLLHNAYSISNNTDAERYFTALQNASSLNSTFVVNDNSVQVATIASPDPRITAVPNQVYKHAAAYKVNDFAATLDGRTPGTATSGTLPTVDRLYLGAGSSGGNIWLNGHIAKFYYWNTRRTNQVLQNLTE